MSEKKRAEQLSHASLSVVESTRGEEGVIRLRLAGDWLIGSVPLSYTRTVSELLDDQPERIIISMDELGRWDSALVTYLIRVRKACDKKGVILDTERLPEGAQRLLRLAGADSHAGGAVTSRVTKTPLLERIADQALMAWRHGFEMVSFLGEVCVAFGRLLVGRARCRTVDVLAVMVECGARALPIVSLISVLVGLILAFVGAVQLSLFGAQIYVASLVGIAVVRVMGAVMAGIIMAGRTGAAFAAELGTMQVNEEIDALVTLGINPVEFLVVPRVLALVLMMPLLCLYADLMGILGGLFVGVFMLDLNVMEYLEMTKKTVQLTYFWIGLFHSGVFGVLVALAGCLRGMQCGRSASAVGNAATSAVVTGIVSIVVATAVITVMCNVLGI